MSRTDMLVLIPIIPLFPVIATWFLPWEEWLPRRIPKLILGPYLLYAAFAAWYLRFGDLTVILVLGIAVVTTIAGIFEKVSDRTSHS